MICVLNILFESLEIQERSHLVYSDNDTMLVHASKICHDFWFDTLDYTI